MCSVVLLFCCCDTCTEIAERPNKALPGRGAGLVLPPPRAGWGLPAPAAPPRLLGGRAHAAPKTTPRSRCCGGCQAAAHTGGLRSGLRVVDEPFLPSWAAGASTPQHLWLVRPPPHRASRRE
jgi:hypothetical protein